MSGDGNEDCHSPVCPGPIALVGSGEYLPEMAGVEAGLLAGRPGRYVQLATAAVPDGPKVVQHWHELGRRQAERLGVAQVVVPVAERRDADDPSLAALVNGAGLIYLSGGHPAYLAGTLRGTLVWEAIVMAWRSGAALAGCSAGAMAMAKWVPDLRSRETAAVPGLGFLPHIRVVPHFDRFSSRTGGRPQDFLIDQDAGLSVIGVDEETALVGGPWEWLVQGHRSAWELSTGGAEHRPMGTTVHTPASPSSFATAPQ